VAEDLNTGYRETNSSGQGGRLEPGTSGLQVQRSPMPLPGQMESIYFKHCFDISYPAQSYRNVKKKLGSDDLRTQYFEACWLIRAQTSVSQSERAFYSVHCIMNNSRKERGLWKHTRFENKFESRIRTQSRARCLM